MRSSLFLFILILTVKFCNASIKIDSLTSTNSTCPNNGIINVFAQTNNPPLLYSITAGPTLRPNQSGFIFEGLKPGTYTITVTNLNNETTSKNITISRNYKEPDLNHISRMKNC